MTEAGDREQLGDALQDAEHDRLEVADRGGERREGEHGHGGVSLERAPGARRMRIFTAASHDRFPLVTKAEPLQGKSTAMERQGLTSQPSPCGTRVDMHCHSTASQESKLGVQRVGRPARVRDASRGGVRARQAARHGPRHDHRPRHDRRRAGDRRPCRRVRVRGADRAVPRRATGGARALLRHHARGSRVAAGQPRRRRAVRRVHVRARHRVRAGASLLPRRRAVDAPATAAGWRSCSTCGRCATEPAHASSTALQRRTSRRSTAPVSAAPTTTRASTSAARGRRRRRRARRRSSSRTCATATSPRAASRAAPPSGRTRRSRWRRGRSAPRARTVPPERPDPTAILNMARRLLSEGDARHGASDGGGAVSPDRRASLLHAWMAAVELDHLDEAGLIAYMQADSFSHSDLYRRACRAHERKLRVAIERALAAARGEADVAGAAIGPVRELHGGDPVRAGDGVPGQRARQARHAPRGRRDAARGAAGRRHRLDARRHSRGRGDPLARRRGIRDRGARHGPRGRPQAVGGGRVRGALLPGTADRRPQPVGRRGDARARAASTSCTCARRAPSASPARSSVAVSAYRCWAAITPS